MKLRHVASGMTLAAGVLTPIVVTAQTARLPVPCVASVCGVNIPGFVQTGQATAIINGNTLRVQQATERAILNWSSFDVGPDGRVIFSQPGASSVALNRIFQGSPSEIFGAIEANGQIYLINQNGFVFGAGSRVRTAGLLVSTLGMTDSTFQNGLLAPELLQSGKPPLASDGRVGVLDAEGNPVLDVDGKPVKVNILVQQGAELTTSGSGNRILLAGQNIDNAGKISAADGQVILAAGEEVFLEASTDPALRGLLVEVNRGGDAWNRLTGEVSAARGNVTIAGLAVNQLGRVSATTTVAANGSIRLQARDTVEQVDGHYITKHAGEVELGSQSITSVLPELGDLTTAVKDQPQLESSVKIMGHQVRLRSGSAINVPGGKVEIAALADPSRAAVAEFDRESSIHLEAGASIDVSGSTATAPITRNLVSVELRANELKDAPLQRDGALRGRTVVVDARVGTPFGDVQGALDAVPRGIAERTSAGGTAAFTSQGNIVVDSSATVDVSGGVVNYTGGTIQTSQLIGADGSVVDIGLADPNKVYVGLINPTFTRRYDRWGVVETVAGPSIGRFEPGYVEGRSAGTLQFASPTMILNGNFQGSAISGPFQRDPANTADGGRFVVGLLNGLASYSPFDHRAPSVEFVTTPPPIVVGDQGTLPQALTLSLPVDFMQRGGFTRTEIYSNGVVTLPEALPLTVAPGSSLTLLGHRIDIGSDITAHSGSIALTAQRTAGTSLALPRPGVQIAPDVTLDVSGTWINDVADANPASPPLTNVLYRDAGSISLNVNANVDAEARILAPAELVIGDDVSFLANGGAWLQASGVLTPGRGGRIALSASGNDNVFEIGNDVRLQAYGVLGASGGTFELTAGRIAVESGTGWAHAQRFDPVPPAPEVDPGEEIPLDPEAPEPIVPEIPPLVLSTGLFSQYGFSNFTLTATGARAEESPDVLTVRSGAVVDTRASSLQLLGLLPDRRTGSALLDFAQVMLAPEIDRRASTLTLNVSPTHDDRAPGVGRIHVEEGSSLLGDPRSTFNFSGPGDISLDGAIVARGGTVRATIVEPAEAYEAGYLSDLQIAVGRSGSIDVSGTELIRSDDLGFRTGELLAGGTIQLRANRGSINLSAGSRLDASGAATTLDVPTGSGAGAYTRQNVASAGGSIELLAPESIVWLGSISAAAGVGTGTAGVAPGGSLSVVLGRDESGSNFPSGADLTPFPTGPRSVRVTADVFAGEPQALNGLALLDPEKIRDSGVASLSLVGGDLVEFDAGVSLSLDRSLTVAAPEIAVRGGGEVDLDAAYVAFGHGRLPGREVTSTPGTGTLNVRGDMIELLGATTLSGMDLATFTSSGDLRLRSLQDNSGSAGALRIAGDLTLSAARIYPATATSFTLSASGGETDVIRFQQNGTSSGTPLSVAGSLRVDARQIYQGGTLIAPFGSISLHASETLSLLDGSVTSVSAGNTVLPYGRVQLGTDWVYQLSSLVPQTAIPERSVELSAANVQLAATSTVDIRGGGDLYAYEWIPGTGGSSDALDPEGSAGLYAILPSMRGEFAPYDPQEFGASALRPGDSVYLAGTNGLEAGVYPLLPARYALLPGALLIRALPDSENFRPEDTKTLADGARVIAGYRTFANTGLGETTYSGYSIQPGSHARQLATYQDSFASTFYPARAQRLDIDRPAIPADAGLLLLNPTESLLAQGKVLTAAASGGRGATVALAAENLTVTGHQDASLVDTVQIESSALSNWAPSRLVLGGSYNEDAGGVEIEVQANRVAFTSDAIVAADEVIMVARESVSIDGSSSVATHSSAHGELAEVGIDLIGDRATDAAVIALSDTSSFDITRPEGMVTPGLGRIEIDRGAQVRSRGSLLFTAPGSASIAGTIDGAGAAWDIESGRIAFTNAPIADGIAIDAALSAAIQQGATIRLASSGAIEFLNPTIFGSRPTNGTYGIESLTLSAASIRTARPGVDVTLNANEVTLLGAAAADAPAVAGSGALTINAETMRIGAGESILEGFGTAALNANAELIGEGTSSLRTSGDLTLSSARLTTGAGAATTIESAGALVVRSMATATPDRALDLGGALTLKGETIEHAGTIALPTGLVRLDAHSQLTIAAGAVIDVSGTTVAAAGRELSSWGGTIGLASGGDILAATGSSIRLNGAGGADAGRLLVHTGGTATLQGDLSASAATGARGGTFVLDAASLPDFAPLNSQLQAGGFRERRDLHVAGGDLVLAAGQSIDARFVSLATDAGSVRIAGTIDATSDNERSTIGLFGANGVVLEKGSVLHATGIGDESRGGLITLGTTSGAVDLFAGSTIATGGGTGNGRVLVRAPAVGSDVAIGAWGGTFTDVDAVTIEPMLVSTVATDVLTATEYDSYFATAAAYAAAAVPTIRDRIETPAGTSLQVQPGIEIRHVGDLSLQALELSGWRFDGEPGALTVRATGSISIDGGISDGFVNIGSGNTARTDLSEGRSTTLRFTAGSLFSSADPTAVDHSLASDLTIGDGSIVRTGTGDLALSAARDIAFVGNGSSAYTAGVAGEPSYTPVATRGSPVSFATRGGQLEIDAGRDILGASVSRSVSRWQSRGERTIAGDEVTPGFDQSYWGADIRQFGWDAGTLGGGDVNVRAGGAITNVAVAAADSAIELTDGVLTKFGGGTLTVDAGGDISTALLHSTHGRTEIRTDGALASSRFGEGAIGSLLFIQDAAVDVKARGGALIESVLMPTLLNQGLARSPSAPFVTPFFNTHTAQSALTVEAASGDVAINPTQADIGLLLGVTDRTIPSQDPLQLVIAPPNLALHSMSGDVALGGLQIVMTPSDRGQLDIVAANDFLGGSFSMSDGGSGDFPAAPVAMGANQILAVVNNPLLRGRSGRHLGDLQPVEITAGHDIVGGSMFLPKAVRMVAGNDIIDASITTQNVQASDVTLLSAGRDLRFGPDAQTGQIEVGGPGRLDVIAGRDVDLGFSKGISTVGRLVNPNLTSVEGADINVLAGFGRDPDVGAFIAAVVAGSDEYRAALIKFVASETGEAPASFETAARHFTAFDAATQRPFIIDTFFHELVASGREANADPELGFGRGFAAIDSLFPGSRPQDASSAPNPFHGDLLLAFSRIYTISGGTISLLAPGGLLNLGLANPPASLAAKSASELGIVAQQAGDVRAFTDGDVLVNQSRIFTLGGGDIAIWSTTGDIDAGRGSKSAISAPPPTVQVDAAGTVTLNFGDAVSGSGIRTILTGAATEPGDVDLIAPAGIVNAGDAGIGSAGNLNVAAQTVVGLDNIQVGGSSTGVPAETSSLGASLSGVSGTASSAANASNASVQEPAPTEAAQKSLAESALSWLDVFVVGLGEEQCSPGDIECVKRQATPPPR